MKNSVIEKSNSVEELLNKAYDALDRCDLYNVQMYLEKLESNYVDNNINVVLLKVRVLMEYSSYKEALNILNNIIKENNRDYRVYLYRGKIYMSIGEKELGYDDLKNADLLSNNIEVRYNLVRAAVSCKKYIEARDIINDLFHYYNDKYLTALYESSNNYIIDDLIKKDEKIDSNQKIDLAKSYKYLGNIKKAMDVLNSIDDIRNYPNAVLLLSNCLRINKKYDKALMNLDKYIVDNYDKLYEVYYIRGLILEDMGKYSESLEFYYKCINANKDYKPVYNRITRVLLKFNYYNRAFEMCEKAIKINYDKFISLNNKGIIYFYLTKYDESLKCFDECIDEFPFFLDGYINKSMILRKKDENREALNLCNNIIEKGNKNNEILVEKSLILINLKKYNEALNLINKSLKCYRGGIYNYYVEALCLCKMKKFNDAISTVDYAIIKYRNNDIILVSLKAYIFISMNKYSNMLEVMREYFKDYETEDKDIIIKFIDKINYCSSIFKRDFTYEKVTDYLNKIIKGINK